jgi:hypothetical protein
MIAQGVNPTPCTTMERHTGGDPPSAPETLHFRCDFRPTYSVADTKSFRNILGLPETSISPECVASGFYLMFPFGKHHHLRRLSGPSAYPIILNHRDVDSISYHECRKNFGEKISCSKDTQSWVNFLLRCGIINVHFDRHTFSTLRDVISNGADSAGSVVAVCNA